MKRYLIFPLVLFLFFSFHDQAFAKLVINEFSSYSADDWIEVYNDGSDPVLLSEFRFRDSTATNKLDLEGTIFSYTVVAIDWNNRLNKAGDTIKIVAKADESKIEDQITYGTASIPAPGENQSAGRKTNGGGEWSLFAGSSKGSSNEATSAIQSPPTVTLAPTGVPTPTKNPTPTKVPTAAKVPTVTKVPTPTKTSATAPASNSTSQKNSNSVLSANKTAVLEVSDAASRPTSVLMASGSEEKSEEEQVIVGGAKESNLWQQIVRFLPVFLGTASLAFCGILVYFHYRKSR